MSTIFVVTYTKQGSTSPLEYSIDKILNFDPAYLNTDVSNLRFLMYEKHIYFRDILRSFDGYQTGFTVVNDEQNKMFSGSIWQDENSFHNASLKLINDYLILLQEFNTVRKQFCLLHNIFYQVNGLFNSNTPIIRSELTFESIHDIIQSPSLSFENFFIK